MSFSFPRVDAKTNGYEPSQVDEFVSLARQQFAEPTAEIVTSNVIRNTEFDLIHGGYDLTAVDTAMDRLEDTFATREIQRQKLFRGEFAVSDRLDRIREIVQGRLERPKRKRFASTGYILRGYSRKQVDQLCDVIKNHLDEGKPLQLNTVRRAIFKAKRGGYVESQVDAFIDRVVEVIQLENNR